MVVEQITEKLNIIRTDVQDFPKYWERKNIVKNSILKARIGWQGLTTKEYQSTGKFFLVTGTDFKNNKIDWEKCVYVNKERYDQDKNIQIKKDDILITKDGTIGKIAYVDTLPMPATLNSGIFVIRPKNKEYLSSFLFHILSSNYFKKFLNKLKAGSTINHLYQKDFMNFDFFVPSYQKQEKITRVLSNTSKLIEQLEYTIKKKQNIKHGAMQELLTGKTRLKGFEDKWITKRLGTLANITMGQSPKSKYYNKKGEGLPLIQGNADIQNRKTISRTFTTMYPKKGKIGDTIMSVRAPVGEIAKATFDCCLGRGVCAIFYQNEYVYHYMVFIENKWTSLSTGSTFDSINSKEVNNIELFIPKSNEEQISIAEILSNMDLEIKELEGKKDKYIMIKNGMMQKLLTGEIRLV